MMKKIFLSMMNLGKILKHSNYEGIIPENSKQKLKNCRLYRKLQKNVKQKIKIKIKLQKSLINLAYNQHKIHLVIFGR